MTDFTRRTALLFGGVLAASVGSASVREEPSLGYGKRIRHTVVFRLKWASESKEEIAFFEATKTLAVLPGVQRFERLRQISPKNSYKFGLSMEFEDAIAYSNYNSHPAHQEFLRNFWVPGVDEFMEIDYSAMS